MSGLEVFFAEHQRLRDCCLEMRALALSKQRPDMDHVTAARWRFTRSLLLTLNLKDRLVFPRIRANLNARSRAIGAKFERSTRAEYERFAAHTEEFPPERVIRSWRIYAKAALIRISDLEKRLDREEAELFPLLKSSPHVAPSAYGSTPNWAGEAWKVRALLGMDHREASLP